MRSAICANPDTGQVVEEVLHVVARTDQAHDRLLVFLRRRLLFLLLWIVAERELRRQQSLDRRQGDREQEIGQEKKNRVDERGDLQVGVTTASVGGQRASHPQPSSSPTCSAARLTVGDSRLRAHAHDFLDRFEFARAVSADDDLDLLAGLAPVAEVFGEIVLAVP